MELRTKAMTIYLTYPKTQKFWSWHPSLGKQTCHCWVWFTSDRYPTQHITTGRGWKWQTHSCAGTSDMFIYPCVWFSVAPAPLTVLPPPPFFFSTKQISAVWFPDWGVDRAAQHEARCLWQHIKATFHLKCLPPPVSFRANDTAVIPFCV